MENVCVTAVYSSVISSLVLLLLLLYSRHVYEIETWGSDTFLQVKAVHQVWFITRKMQGEEFKIMHYGNK